MIRLFLFAMIFLFCACNQEKHLDIEMSEDDLIAILQDVHIANSIILKYRVYERDSVSQIMRSQIAEIHNISIEEFDYVMEQMQLSPARYLGFEKKAVENLKELKDSLKLTTIIKADN